MCFFSLFSPFVPGQSMRFPDKDADPDVHRGKPMTQRLKRGKPKTCVCWVGDILRIRSHGFITIFHHHLGNMFVIVQRKNSLIFSVEGFVDFPVWYQIRLVVDFDQKVGKPSLFQVPLPKTNSSPQNERIISEFHQFFQAICLAPRKQTWNLKITPWKRRNITPQITNFGVPAVSFQGCSFREGYPLVN